VTSAFAPEAPARTTAHGIQDFITFKMDGRSYALPLVSVAEILRYRELNKMPHMPKTVEGILDLRGEVVPVVSLRTRLGLPSPPVIETCFILVVDLGGSKAGLLVDAVESVLHATEEELVPSSRLLAGPEGAWVSAFIVRGERVLAQLDPYRVATPGTVRAKGMDAAVEKGMEHRLDESLKELIQLAPPKDFSDPSRKIIPQIEESIRFTEQEVEKVLARVESMLSGSDKAFQAIAFLKQEVGLGHLKGHEATVAELERATQAIQDGVFDLINTVQFQDIARQKLERILAHLRGMQGVLASKLRDERPHS
jgi:purine-binding chemotaxis protein CheW